MNTTRTFHQALLHLAADLLDVASATFANHGCNDLETPEWFGDFNLRDFADLMDEHNSGGKTGDALTTWRAEHPDDATDADKIRHYMTDFAAMSTLAYGLRKMAAAPPDANLYDQRGLSCSSVEIERIVSGPGEPSRTASEVIGGVVRIGRPVEVNFMTERRQRLAEQLAAE